MEGVRKRKVPQCVCPVAEHTGCQHPSNSLLLWLVAPGKQGRREIHEEDRASRGDQPPVVTTPVTSFTSLNYNQQHAPKVRLVSDSRLIGAADDFLDVESCIPGVLEIWTISVGVSGRVRKSTSVDPSGEMM